MKAPSLNWYPDKWLADTRRLSWKSKGIYHELLMVIWMQFQDTCTIPDDDPFIASEIGCLLEDWVEVKQELMNPHRPLLELKSGGLTNQGLQKALEKRDIFREKQSKNGRKGGRPENPKKAMGLKIESQTKPKKSLPIPIPIPIPNSLFLEKESNLKNTNIVGQARHSAASELKKQAGEVLAFLNEKAGKNFRPVDANLNFIIARLQSGATVEECRAIIAKKRRDWSGDAEMQIYLRPETLFNKTKFESYIGELAKEAING